MRRFIATYRWELWLLLWTPLLSGIASVLVFSLLASLYDDHVVPHYVVYAQGAATSLVHAGLLLVFYGRVRRLERRFLTLVWGYALGLVVMGALVWLIVVALALDDEGSGLFSTSQWVRSRLLVHGLAALLPLFWFARRAARISLAHAYLLFLILKAYSLTTVIATALNLWLFDLVPVGLLIALTFASILGLGLLLAWLLGNFESRGPRLRRLAVGLLLAAHAVSVVWEPLGAMVLQDRLAFARLVVDLIAPLALIYLLRVRNPSPPVKAEPPTDLRVQ